MIVARCSANYRGIVVELPDICILGTRKVDGCDVSDLIGHLVPHELHIDVIDRDSAVTTKAFVRNRGARPHYKDTITWDTLDTIQKSTCDACSKAQQQNQHQQPPENSEGRHQRTPLVAADSLPYLLPKFFHTNLQPELPQV